MRIRNALFLLGVMLSATLLLKVPHDFGVTRAAYAQQRSTTQQAPPISPSLSSTPEGPNDPFRAGMEARRVKMQNDERHKRLVTDTEKLLALSNELKQDVDKSTKNELSLDVIRKAAEIEKLARDVKERMRS